MIYPLPAQEAIMTGQALREVFEAVLPRDLIDGFARFFGVVERERSFDVAAFVRCAVMAVGSPGGGLQADMIRNYLDSVSKPMARSALYRKFDEEFEALMEA